MSLTVMCSNFNFAKGGKCGNRTKTTPGSSVNSILPNELAQYLQANTSELRSSNDYMLLDCRPFFAYNMKHIAGAFNVNCTGIGKKRLQQGKASLADLISPENGKDHLTRGNWVKAVLYDDSTSDLEKAPATHPIKVVLSSLISQGKDAILLKGKSDYQFKSL